jgi:putative membrane protein
MTNYYWNDWYSGWGWVLWYGFVLLVVSNAGNWGYSYRIHRKYRGSHKDALTILNERYARGEGVSRILCKRAFQSELGLFLTHGRS